MDHGKILVDIPICANRNPQCLHDFASQIVFLNGFMMIFMYIACPFLAMDFSIFCKANPVVMFFMAPWIRVSVVLWIVFVNGLV